MTGPSVDYNLWHQQRWGDDDVVTPWHTFVADNLLRKDIEGTTLLEIGCGRGGFSNYLASGQVAPARIFACDYSPSALEIAAQKYAHEKIIWRREDIMNLSFADNTFDTIISCETIEHVENPARAISELYRVLKPGGRFFLTCPSYFNPFGIWCLYRWIIGKPFTEGGQPYVNYILMPVVYYWLKRTRFDILHFSSAEIIIPARVPKHFYNKRTPWWLRFLGHRTFYIAKKG